MFLLTEVGVVAQFLFEVFPSVEAETGEINPKIQTISSEIKGEKPGLMLLGSTVFTHRRNLQCLARCPLLKYENTY